jgi:hypothetical protein
MPKLDARDGAGELKWRAGSASVREHAETEIAMSSASTDWRVGVRDRRTPL